jgi:predicted HTH transcriptional regulator
MDDLAQLLSQPESRTLEFKRDLSSLSGILKTLVAFANTTGGTLVIGREDDGSLRSVSDIHAEEERLSNAIADGIHPVLLPDIEIASIEEVDLLVVRVARWPGPFYLKAMGSDKGVYIRLGSTNRRASPDALAELRRAASHLVFDHCPVWAPNWMIWTWKRPSARSERSIARSTKPSWKVWEWSPVTAGICFPCQSIWISTISAPWNEMLWNRKDQM